MVSDTVIVKTARHSMGTRFEIVVCGDDEITLRAAAERALDEIEQVEEQLSIYIPDSDISDINARAANEPVKVEPQLFQLLKRAAELNAATWGAFDITVAPVMRALNAMASQDENPPDDEAMRLEDARQSIGMSKVILDDALGSVRFLDKGVMLDLGGIGKGYAIERAVAVLRDANIVSAFIHGGTSSIYALGSPPGQDAWLVGVTDAREPNQRIATLALRDKALSVSSIYGWKKAEKSKRCRHVIDPHTGMPSKGVLRAYAISSSPTDVDALSTAFLVLGVEGVREYCKQHPEVGALLMLDASKCEKCTIVAFGLDGIIKLNCAQCEYFVTEAMNR